MIILQLNSFLTCSANILRNIWIFMCLPVKIKKRISGMHKRRPKQVKLKLELFLRQFWNFIFLAFFRLKFWEKMVINLFLPGVIKKIESRKYENMVIYLCLPGVIRKNVSGNQKRRFRIHQIRPKEVKFKFELFFMIILKFNIFCLFGPKFWEICWYTCVLWELLEKM